MQDKKIGTALKSPPPPGTFYEFKLAIWLKSRNQKECNSKLWQDKKKPSLKNSLILFIPSILCLSLVQGFFVGAKLA